MSAQVPGGRSRAARGFRVIGGDGPLRVVVVGAGGMGSAWLRTASASGLVDLVGVVDLDESAAARAVAELPGPQEVRIGASLTEVAGHTAAEAVINVTVPEAHLPVTREALLLGLPVLGEKPMAATLPESLALVELAEETGELFMVSQNRRFNRHLWELKALTARLGRVGILTHEFFKAPRFGGFRELMEHPLVLDMAVHNFDSARFVLDADPVTVFCEEYNPGWSWYDGDAAGTALFEMTGGARFIYTGSWCAPGLETSWNSEWRISASRGSALWDGEGEPRAEFAGALPRSPGAPAVPDFPGENLEGSLALFVRALRTGETPMGECHDNLQSLAMVHAAITSSKSGSRVQVADVLRQARSGSTSPALAGDA